MQTRSVEDDLCVCGGCLTCTVRDDIQERVHRHHPRPADVVHDDRVSLLLVPALMIVVTNIQMSSMKKAEEKISGSRWWRAPMLRVLSPR